MFAKWIIPGHVRAMPFHRPAPDSLEYARLVQAIEQWQAEDPALHGPIYLWMPEWLNTWLWELWAWTRRLRGMPIGE